jgi:hypothetical protein
VRKYRILSPDGFDISFEQMYYKQKEVQQALKDFQNRFIAQGYYSTGDRTRIPFDSIITNCEVLIINK